MTERKRHKGDRSERRGGARAVADMLPDIGGTAFRRFGFVQSSVVTRWREIVGDRYADVTAPESIRFPVGERARGQLTLLVDSAHAPMVQHVAPAIIERVNRFFGYAAVERINFRQGRVTPTKRRSPAPRAPAPVPASLGDSLRAISDPELRECLAALAGALAASTGVPEIPAANSAVKEEGPCGSNI